MPQIKTYNKPVLDFVPDSIRAKGLIPHTRVMTDPEEIDRGRRAKVAEEANEVLNATDRRELIKEIADIEIWLRGVMRHNGITPQAVRLAKNKKLREMGDCDGNVYLESVEVPDGVEDGRRD